MKLYHGCPLFVAISILGVSSGQATEPPIVAVSFSPDAHVVVTASQSGVRCLAWPEMSRQREIRTAVTNPNEIVFSPNGKQLAIAGGRPSEEGVVEIVSWPAGKSLRFINEHIDSVMAVRWLSDTLIATASLDHGIQIVDTMSGELVRTLKGHSRGVTSLAVVADDVLVSAGIDQSLRVWKTRTGELQRSLNIHTRPIHALARRPAVDGLPMLASVSEDRTVRFWQPTIGRMVRFARLESQPLCAAWLLDGSQVVVACTNGHVYFVDPETVKVTQDVAAIEGWAYALAVHPASRRVVVGGSDGQLSVVGAK